MARDKSQEPGFIPYEDASPRINGFGKPKDPPTSEQKPRLLLMGLKRYAVTVSVMKRNTGLIILRQERKILYIQCRFS